MKKIYIIIFKLLVGCYLMKAQQVHHVQGEILVQVNDEAAMHSLISKVKSLKRSNVDLHFKPLGQSTNWYSVYFDFVKYDEKELLAKIKGQKKVIAAQYNRMITPRDKNPNDSLFKNQWQWQNTGLNGTLKALDTKAYLAWYKSTGGKTKSGKEIVVAIIDDGTELDHPDLKDNIWHNKQEIAGNGVDDDQNGYVDDYWGWNVLSSNDSVQYGEHGVSVNGLIGAKGNNKIGVSGLNWNIKMMNLKYDVRLGIKESDVIAAYSYILNQRKLYNKTNGTKGAFIVASNASWGIDEGKPEDSPLWCNIYDSLGKAGILNVAAADNRTNVDIDSKGDLPCLCPSDHLLAVTSFSSDGIRTGAFGVKNIDLAAPGDKIFTTRPQGQYGFDSGTSFAAPIVTGAIGFLYSNACGYLDELAISKPSEASQLIKKALMSTVDTMSSLVGMTVSGGYINLIKAMDFVQAPCAACASGAQSSRIFIDSIVVDGLKHKSGNNQGYADFTSIDSLTPVINQDGQILLKIFPKSNDSILNYNIRIWIDRNRDNDFDDTAELVWQNGSRFTSGFQVSNIYLAPTKIDSIGKSKLRISLKAITTLADTSKPGPCDFFTAGEVEDYAINILPKTFDCPDVLELVSATISEDAAKITYQKIIPKLFYLIRYKEIAANKWDTLPTRDTVVSLNGLKKCTEYIVESKTLCDSDTSRFKTMLKFRTTGCTVPLAQSEVFFETLVFPNPVIQDLTFRFKTKKPLVNASLRIVSLNGNVIRQEKIGNLSSGYHEYVYNLHTVMSGVYYIQLQSSEGSMTKKILKM